MEKYGPRAACVHPRAPVGVPTHELANAQSAVFAVCAPTPGPGIFGLDEHIATVQVRRHVRRLCRCSVDLRHHQPVGRS